MSAYQKSEIVRLAENGQFNKAKILCKKLCKKIPNDPEAWFLYGSVNGADKDFSAAEYCCKKALKLAPLNPTLLYNLGIALLNQGKIDSSIKQFTNAIKINPKYSDAYLEIGNALKFTGNSEEAITNYKKAIQFNPSTFLAYYYIAEAYHQTGEFSEAIRYYEQTIVLQDTHVDSYCGLASTLISLFKFDKAIHLLESNISRLPVTACLYFYLAFAYQEQGNIEKAKFYFKRVIDIDRNHYDAQTGLAGLLALQGDYEKADERLRGILKSEPDHVSATIAFTSFASQFKAIEEAIQMGKKCLEKDKLNNISKSKLVFALANLYEQTGKLDKAFEYYRMGNKLKGAVFDEKKYNNMFDSLKATYTADVIEKLQNVSKNSVNPIFIIGMPRSGTSLAEQILASHPDVYGAGELPTINRIINQLPSSLKTALPYPECLEKIDKKILKNLASQYLKELQLTSNGEKNITDKMPLNSIHLGFISLMFPTARIIYCTRDPRDTCLSCYFKNFSGEHPYAYSLNSLGKFYRMHEKLMAHWLKVIPNPTFELSYEKIVKDPDAIIRELIDYCGLDWDNACMDFHKTKRAVATASHSQVRKKMYSSSVGKWRHYEQHLGKLFSALEPTS